MADRRVAETGKDSDGDIIRLCNIGIWPSVSRDEAIKHIENGVHTYYVNAAGYRTDVHVVKVGFKKYLRTTADKTSKNNLDNLPDC